MLIFYKCGSVFQTTMFQEIENIFSQSLHIKNTKRWPFFVCLTMESLWMLIATFRQQLTASIHLAMRLIVYMSLFAVRYIKDTIYITTTLVYDIPRIIMWYILIIKYLTRFFSCLDVKVYYNLDPNEQMLVCCWISLLRECRAGMVILWPQHTWQDCFPQPASCCLIE